MLQFDATGHFLTARARHGIDKQATDHDTLPSDSIQNSSLSSRNAGVPDGCAKLLVSFISAILHGLGGQSIGITPEAVPDDC